MESVEHQAAGKHTNDPRASDPPRLLSRPLDLLAAAAITVFIGEMLVMFTLSLLPPLSTIPEAVLDSLLLLAVIVPAYYFLLLRPMRMHVARRKEAERALRESEELYKDFVEGTADLVTQVDANGDFTFVNGTARTVFGLEPSECVGLSAFDFVHPDDREHTSESFLGWVREGVSNATFENRQVSRTGEVHSLLWTSSFHRDQATDSIRVNGIARDITDLRQMEQALQGARSGRT